MAPAPHGISCAAIWAPCYKCTQRRGLVLRMLSLIWMSHSSVLDLITPKRVVLTRYCGPADAETGALQVAAQFRRQGLSA